MVENSKKEVVMGSKEEMLEQIKHDIFEKLKEYYTLRGKNEFIPGKERILYAGAVFDENEAMSMVDSILKGWFGLGPKARAFTEQFSQYLGVFKTVMVSSGSSANLLAFSALRSKKLKRLYDRWKKA